MCKNAIDNEDDCNDLSYVRVMCIVKSGRWQCKFQSYQFTHHVSVIAITHRENNFGQMCDKTAIKAQINDVQALSRGRYSEIAK